MDRPPAGLYKCVWLLCLTVLCSCAAPLHVAVVAPQQEHLAWDSAQILQQDAATAGLTLVLDSATPNANQPLPTPDFIVMPLRSLASQIPALEILELPYLFDDLNATHHALDGELGDALRDIARQQQWEILAFWDEGLHMMSGLRRYDRVANLNGMEFLLTRPDPVAERQFLAWRATPRHIQLADHAAVLRECLIASRAATLQEIKREGLERVHMTLSLTGHRYEGWLLLAPAETWVNMSTSIRKKMDKLMPQVTKAQRTLAARREAEALTALRAAGFIVYDVNADARQAFIDRLPDRSQLLANDMDTQTRQRLLELTGIRDHNNYAQSPPVPATTP